MTARKKYEIVYRMLPAQRRFHFCRKPFVLYTGGYGAGKTYGLCMKALALSLENAPIPVGLIAPSIPMMKRDLLLVMKNEILESYGIPYRHHRTEHRFEFPLWNGAIQLASADEPESLKGPSWAAVGFNEPGIMKHEAYLIGISRARHPRAKFIQVFLAGTPEGFNWLYEEFIVSPRDTHEVIFAPTRENTFLPEFYYDRLRDSYDPRLVEMYLEGKFVNPRKGRVYYAFDRLIHLGDFTPSPLLPLGWTWDFNVYPMSSLILQHERGRVWALDEIVIRESSSTQEVINEFIRRGYHQHPGGVRIYGDACGHKGTGKSDYQVMREAGFTDLQVPRANPDVRDRVNAVNARFNNAKGEVNLFIDRRCLELIKDLEQVVYKEGSGELDKTDPQRTHTSDALGYFIHREYPLRPRAQWFKY